MKIPSRFTDSDSNYIPFHPSEQRNEEICDCSGDEIDFPADIPETNTKI
jgi:hypothetical protein